MSAIVEHDDSVDDYEDEASSFEVINTDDLQTDLARRGQGEPTYLGDQIKLGKLGMINLKDMVDKAINPENSKSNLEESQDFDVTDTIQDLRVPASSDKLKQISVSIEDIEGRKLVKVGPCDLSGVGGHHVREQIIKNVVEQALRNKGFNETYENVNVSACVGVRGRLQMIVGAFIDNREQAGSHMNAYVKMANEPTLTHWEPRKGPQSFFNLKKSVEI